jgi:hypothetical protein
MAGRSLALTAVLTVAAVMSALPSPLVAQEPDAPPVEPDTVQAIPDTLQAVPDTVAGALDTAESVPDAGPATGEGGAQRERPVSPGGALLRSIILPGWGQVAADQPARGGIYFTVWSGGVFMILKANSELNAAKRGEDEELIDSRSQAREDWILFTGLWALLSGVDAWVSAHLSGF